MTPQPVIRYGISKVHYDRAHSRIVSVWAHHVNGRTIGHGSPMRRLDVVRKILGGSGFVTLPETNGRRLRLGQRVAVLREKFLRSIPNGKHTDDLRGLPEF